MQVPYRRPCSSCLGCLVDFNKTGQSILPVFYYSPGNLPLYNTVHYSTILDITLIIAVPQVVIKDLIL